MPTTPAQFAKERGFSERAVRRKARQQCRRHPAGGGDTLPGRERRHAESAGDRADLRHHQPCSGERAMPADQDEAVSSRDEGVPPGFVALAQI